MKITNIEYFKIDLEMIYGYTIAYETINKASNVILRIDTSNGHSGWGCAAPDLEITYECAEDVVRNIEEHIRPMIVGQDPLQLARFVGELKGIQKNMSSTIAMLDIALHDLMARMAGVPLYKLMGGYRSKIQTSITIGIMTLEETMGTAEQYWKDGFNIFKLKGGLNVDEDIEKVFKLRERFGQDLLIRFDANQGYHVADSVKFIDQTKKAGIELFEQPTKYRNDDAMRQVTDRVSVPVMADESIRSLKDVFRLSRNDISDMINIKIMKVGGLSESYHINSVAKAAGMEVMVGCLDECAMGICAGLHFALSRPNVEYADLDGHLDFSNDPFTHLFKIEKGWMIPSDAQGLGNIRI